MEVYHVPEGMPCNVCDPGVKRLGAMIPRMNPEGDRSRGLRPEHPEHGWVWPAPRGWRRHPARWVEPGAGAPGLHFGFSFRHSTSIPDPGVGRLPWVQHVCFLRSLCGRMCCGGAAGGCADDGGWLAPHSLLFSLA